MTPPQTDYPSGTERLIERLTSELTPVRPLRSPALRAALWLAIVLVLMGIAVWMLADWHAFSVRMAVTRRAVECVAIAVTGFTAIFAAFIRSVPGRAAAWTLLPLPPLAAWLASSGLGCFQNGWSLHGTGGVLGASPHCFVFILGVSIPLSIALFIALRRARPIAPLPVAALGSLGVAALAAFALEFFHPFDVTLIDLLFHLAAMGVVIGTATAWRGRMLAADG